jgi:hypothetical protein
MKKILVLLLLAASGMFAQTVKPIQITGVLNYLNSPMSANLNVGGLYVAISGSHYTQGSMTATTTAGGLALPVANLANLGWYMIVNNDPTNYVDILTAVSGTAFTRLLPGDFTMGRFNPAITAPAVLAHTASLQISYLILEN